MALRGSGAFYECEERRIKRTGFIERKEERKMERKRKIPIENARLLNPVLVESDNRNNNKTKIIIIKIPAQIKGHRRPEEITSGSYTSLLYTVSCFFHASSSSGRGSKFNEFPL